MKFKQNNLMPKFDPFVMVTRNKSVIGITINKFIDANKLLMSGQSIGKIVVKL